MKNLQVLLDTTTIASVTTAALPHIADLNEWTTLISTIIAILCGCFALAGYASRIYRNTLVPFFKNVFAKIKKGDVLSAVEDVREAVDNIVEEVSKHDPDGMD